MKTIRPFDTDALKPGETGRWLISADEDAGCVIRPRRGGGAADAPTTSADERYAFVIEGEVGLINDAGQQTAQRGEVIFIPPGDAAAVSGDAKAVWLEVSAPVAVAPAQHKSRAIKIDRSKFEGTGFLHQPIISRDTGSTALRLNLVEVHPGAGSPDFHIHAFMQIYVILDGELTVDVGRKRAVAGPNSVVFLPPGLVHRNFNASSSPERHITLLVPEPGAGQIFDYAVTIHEVEAEIMTSAPALLSA